eukprot:12810284-Ditylum_brightwellii.AAC.1
MIHCTKNNRTQSRTRGQDKWNYHRDAENEIPEYPKYWWSDTLHHAYQVVEYWKAVMSFERNNIKENYILEMQRQEIDPEVDIFQGDEKRKAPAQSRKAKKYLT